ncbi:MAG: AmmeMemoRadiSam system protein B [candidate division Zixibacteria bacterium]|nr:AmmeMemoRadiSam system protein B [candidate division Zixibacteria bacterium]
MKFLNCLTIMVMTMACSPSAATHDRAPAVAGAFYPGSEIALKAMVDSLLALAPAGDKRIRPAALVSPHAGYIYSGATAAYGYRLLEELDYSTVVIVGPSHRVGFEGCAVYNQGRWQTPLGYVEINTELAAELCGKNDAIFAGLEQHMKEHSIEVQVPFLQRILSDFEIVPIEMGFSSEKTIFALADVLAEALSGRDDVLLVASTDLSHYFPREQAKEFDSYTISFIENMQGRELAAKIQTDEAKACGGGPTAAVMIACEKMGLDKVRILKYDDSGTTSGDLSRVVGYVSAVIYREDKVREKDSHNKTEEYLNHDEQVELLGVARQSIEAAVNGKPAPAFLPTEGKLTGDGAAFVTITIGGRLRGCIGYTEAKMPLYKCVSDCAISAAMRDPRFQRLTASEYEKIDLEISVLTPLVDVSDIDEIKVGRDGLMISKMGRRGLLLPQVATDNGWDREEFLKNTCRKAGLPDDAWQEGAKIQKFTAFVFSEEEAGIKK